MSPHDRDLAAAKEWLTWRRNQELMGGADDLNEPSTIASLAAFRAAARAEAFEEAREIALAHASIEGIAADIARDIDSAQLAELRASFEFRVADSQRHRIEVLTAAARDALASGPHGGGCASVVPIPRDMRFPDMHGVRIDSSLCDCWRARLRAVLDEPTPARKEGSASQGESEGREARGATPPVPDEWVETYAKGFHGHLARCLALDVRDARERIKALERDVERLTRERDEARDLANRHYQGMHSVDAEAVAKQEEPR